MENYEVAELLRQKFTPMILEGLRSKVIPEVQKRYEMVLEEVVTGIVELAFDKFMIEGFEQVGFMMDVFEDESPIAFMAVKSAVVAKLKNS